MYQYAVDFVRQRVITVARTEGAALGYEACLYGIEGVQRISPLVREYAHEALTDAENYRFFLQATERLTVPGSETCVIDWQWKDSPYPGECEHALRDWSGTRCRVCGHDGIPRPRYT
jgi:hypothetical protein